ncbi:recombinase family protein [Agrobacterium tumefaciens]|uniref:recombinase family protein n=1 Tax=Agrobacterium tumefaciens TaxID=358 RepID=UPI001FFCBA32|nr:recombinase family protein [Agrobacterium tumefaciens]
MDTSSAGGQLIFHILAALAESEKSLIRERTIAGIAAARERGSVPGRRPALTNVQCEEILLALNSGISIRDLAKDYRVHPRTVRRGPDSLT